MKQIRLTLFDLPLAIFWISAVLGLLFVYDPASGQLTLIFLTCMILLFAFISRVAKTDQHWDVLAAVLVGLCAAAGFYFFTQAGHIPYDKKVVLIDQVTKWVATIFPAFSIQQPMPNSMGTFLEGGFFLAVGSALLEKRSNWRTIWWVAAGTIAVGLLFSASRGVWLGIFGAALLWASLYWKPARVLTLMIIAGMLGLILTVLIHGDMNVLSEIPIVGNLVGNLFIRPDRLEVYRHSMALLLEQPLTGIGLGNAFSMVYSRYELLLAVPFLEYSHNLFLEIWLQQGLLGITSFMWLIGTLYASLFRCPIFKNDLRLQAVYAGLTAILLHGLSDARQYPSPWTWLPFFYLLGLCSARLLKNPPLVKSRLYRLLPGSITLILLISIFAISWPPAAVWNSNRAALLQTRADLDNSLLQDEKLAMRKNSEDLFQKALQADPTSLPANQRYGLLLLEEDRFSEAIPHLELAYRLAPDHIAARKGLGLAYLWNGDLEQAAALLKEIPDINEELYGLAWQEYKDFQHYQTSSYTYQLLDCFEPGQPFILEMITNLEGNLPATEN